MEHLIANISGKVRQATLGGKNYLVAPMTLIVPGILNGSKGPLYYPLEEIQNSVDKWNGVPLVVYHPIENGTPLSARNPDVLDRQGIGYVFNAKVVDGKLVAEGWFELEATTRIDNRIIDALNQNKPIELSTGLNAVPDMTHAGVINDINYSGIARNYEPDHLAILPDVKGACSLTDGCGVLNEEKPTEANMAKEALIKELVANCSCWKEEDKEILNNFEESRLEDMVANAKKSKEDSLIANAAREGFEDPNGNLHAFNSKEGKWDFAAKKEEPAPKDPINNEEKKDMTPEEWFEKAPTAVKSALQNAQRIETREKTTIINSLVSHIENEADRQKVANRLASRDLEELEDLALLNNRKEPEKKEEDNTKLTPIWNLGAPVQNTIKVEPLPLPKLDFSN